MLLLKASFANAVISVYGLPFCEEVGLSSMF